MLQDYVIRSVLISLAFVYIDFAYIHLVVMPQLLSPEMMIGHKSGCTHNDGCFPDPI